MKRVILLVLWSLLCIFVGNRSEHRNTEFWKASFHVVLKANEQNLATIENHRRVDCIMFGCSSQQTAGTEPCR